MTGKVITLPGVVRTPDTSVSPSDQMRAVLEEMRPTTAVMIGWGADGGLFVTSSTPDGGDVLWLLAKAQQLLLNS